MGMEELKKQAGNEIKTHVVRVIPDEPFFGFFALFICSGMEVFEVDMLWALIDAEKVNVNLDSLVVDVISYLEGGCG